MATIVYIVIKKWDEQLNKGTTQNKFYVKLLMYFSHNLLHVGVVAGIPTSHLVVLWAVIVRSLILEDKIAPV
jgi:hypothetical protein